MVGIRSVGTTLAAIAAAVLGAGPPESIRPIGHPFLRRVEAHPAIRARLLAAGGTVVVVDEGPGLSGSSFGAVADWLEAGGLPREHIAFLPGHGGDLGPMASLPHRERWQTARRPVVGPDEILSGPDSAHGGLSSWIATVTGPLRSPPVPIGGGAWRALGAFPAARWPASFRMQERLKFLADAPAGPVLAKFTGLGLAGPAKLAMAEALGGAGWTVRPLGLVNGFLLEPWLGATPWSDPPPVRAAEGEDTLVSRLYAYIAFRARRFARGQGAGIADLLAMARHNLAEAGLPAAELVDPWMARADTLQALVRPIAVDGRLHRHEWIADLEGRWLKTDALDHHAAHDLVGCQDAAWDVAGAAVEFGLDADAAENLRARVEHAAGNPVARPLVGALRLAYTAFQLGRSTLAAETETDPLEIERHAADVARYRAAARQAAR